MTQQNKLTKELQESLDITTSLMQNLVEEIKQHPNDIINIREKLETMRVLASALDTKLTSIQKSLTTLEVNLEEYHEDLEEYQDQLKDKEQSLEFKRNRRIAILKIIAVAIPIIVAIVKIIVGN